MNETDKLLQKYINLVIAENGLAIPDFIQQDESIEIVYTEDESQMMQAFLTRARNTHALVITASEEISMMIQASNRNRKNYFTAVLCSLTWENEDMLRELRRLENTLMDEEENDYCLEKQILPHIYTTENGFVVLLGTEYDSVEISHRTLYKKGEKEIAGILLTDPGFSSDRLIGRLSKEDIPLRTRTALLSDICSQIVSRGETQLPDYDTILVFEQGRCLIDSYQQVSILDSAFQEFCFRMLFNTSAGTTNDKAEIMLKSLKDYPLPDFMLRYLQQAYIQNKTISFKKWNLLFRLFRLEEEEKQSISG